MGLQGHLANRRRYGGLVRAERQGSVLDRRFALKFSKGLQSLCLLLRVRINCSLSVSSRDLSLVTRARRFIWVISRGLSNGNYLHSTWRNVSTIASKLTGLSVHS